MQPSFPLDVEGQLRELRDDLSRLIASLTAVRHAEPARRKEGMFAFADGSDWDPGSGRGLYQYVSGAWVKL